MSRIPKVQVSFLVTFQVSCAYRSRFRKLKGSFAEVGKVFVAVDATPVNVLRQGGVGDGRDGALAEVIVIQPKDPGVGSKAQFVRADGSRRGCR